ncbi:MAG: hypothetical protein R6X07_03155 [Desulfatiglandales bacterium]
MKAETKLVNGINVTDLFNTIEAIKKNPEIAKFKFRAKNTVTKSAPVSVHLDEK